MTGDPLEHLLDSLCRGDPHAAEEVFRACEPYLRRIVRRHLERELQAHFDSLDIVQSVWVDLLHGFQAADWHFDTAAQLRAFLIKATRHRLIDRARHHHLARTQPLAEGEEATDRHAAPGPSPSAEAQAGDLWERMLALCPPDHHALLHLRRQGLTLAEIAARTGLHEGSIRRILRQLARELALRPGPADPPRGNAHEGLSTAT